MDSSGRHLLEHTEARGRLASTRLVGWLSTVELTSFNVDRFKEWLVDASRRSRRLRRVSEVRDVRFEVRYHEGVTGMGGWFAPSRWVRSFNEGSSLGPDPYRTILGLVGCKRIADGSTRCPVWGAFSGLKNVRWLVESHPQSCLTELAVGLQCLQDEDRETQRGQNW